MRIRAMENVGSRRGRVVMVDPADPFISGLLYRGDLVALDPEPSDPTVPKPSLSRAKRASKR